MCAPSPTIPTAPGLLFAGTGNGLYYSLDDGGHWTALQTGLPAAPVTWAVVQTEFHDLVVSTYGRGLYILDDITPLEQMAKHRSAGAGGPVRAAQGLSLRARRRRRCSIFRSSAAPKDPVQFEILDSAGKQSSESSKAKGSRRHQPRQVGPALRVAAGRRPADRGARQSAASGTSRAFAMPTRDPSRTGDRSRPKWDRS